MLSFIASLFGCAHNRCTFPITATKSAYFLPEGTCRTATYIVCLQCGKEFPYDWEHMRVVGSAKRNRRAAA